MDYNVCKPKLTSNPNPTDRNVPKLKSYTKIQLQRQAKRFGFSTRYPFAM